MHDTAALGTILGIWAHPDDDIFLSAGLMATSVVGVTQVETDGAQKPVVANVLACQLPGRAM